MGFEPMAGLAACPHVQDHPAVGLRLSFSQSPVDNRAVYDMYFAEPLPDSAFVTEPMSAGEHTLYRQVCQESGLESSAREPAGIAV